MDSPLWHTLSALLGAIVGGGITFLLNRQQFANQLRIIQAQHRTEYMAEETARHFLSHKGFTDRSFDTLRMHLGGFEDDELRKILVRAGAMRVYRDDGSEWWRLVARMDEYIEGKQLGRIARNVIPAQAGIQGVEGGSSGSPQPPQEAKLPGDRGGSAGMTITGA